MYLRNLLTMLLILTSISLSFQSCKSKVSDSELRTKVENALASTPDVLVTVNGGVVTLTGVVASEADRLSLETAAKSADAKHIKSVVNNLTVATAPSTNVTINSNDDDLNTKIKDAVKDFPMIQATSVDGVITVTGEVDQARAMVLKQSLDALNPKRVDMSAVVFK